MIRISTIGYEKCSPDRFVATLREAAIDVVVDVRAVAFSRRPDYSKVPLRALLTGAGIDYVHLPSVGNPEAGRLAARDGRTEEFRAIYLAHLGEPDALRTVEEIRAVASTRSACLLCFERNPANCHRSMLAARLVEGGGDIVDLSTELVSGQVDAQGALPF